MPLNIKNAPSANFAELKNHVPTPIQEAEDHSEHIPHKVFALSLEDVLAGKGLEAATLIAWRYVFKGDDQQYHVAQMGVDEANDSHVFHHINTGRHVKDFIRLHQEIHERGMVQDKDYEMYLINVPGCYVKAVWLQGHDHEHTFVIPLAPVHGKFKAGKKYEIDAFQSLLKAAAQEVTAAYDPTPMPEDDLTRIEGIGPKIAEILKEGGIRSFQALAWSSYNEIERLLALAGPRYNLHDATTWPEQAALAVAGKWDELDKLQDDLKGGRREA